MIIGKQNPVVGVEENYHISDFQIGSLADNNIQYLWYLWRKQKNGTWLDITKKEPKIGLKVSYKLGETFVGTEFKIRVYKATKNALTRKLDTRLFGELAIVPTSSKTPSIERVVLFNAGSKDVNKAHYSDTLIARAHCVAMFNQIVEFHLWEDDAEGPGHNPSINKNNKYNVPFIAKVNEKGIAEAKIKLSSHESVLKNIANTYLMKGDKDEGKNHEYYVTASYYGKIQGASQVNVNVANPDYKKDSPKSQAQVPAQPKQPTASSKPIPKENTAKFPATKTSAAPKQADSRGRITDAYFVNSSGQRLSTVIVGHKIRVRIASNNMKDKQIQYVIWEYDAGSSDEVYRSAKMKLSYDLADMPEITVTQDMFKKGIDFPWLNDPDKKSQSYFIEVIPLDVSAESKKFGVSADGLMKVEKVKSPVVVKKQEAKTEKNCGGKYCIKKGNKSELIREINIRLTGFGGNVPTDEFTDRTEKMIKQFQRDYMKVPETGKICGNVLKAIDLFGDIYTIDINEAKCPCKECNGFGNGLFSEQKNNSKISEKIRKYEYPGIHRSLLWVEKAIKFYLSNQEKQLGLKVGMIFSGYRCNANNKKNKRSSTNHMGKALDLHIYKRTDRNNTEKNADKIRDLLIKYTKAEYRWGGKNVFALEPSSRNRIGEEFIATTWVHYDVRTFSLEYLKDEYFVKDNNKVNGESIISLANRLGFQNTCACNTGFVSQNKKEEKVSSKKYKWSHSEFGNLIAKKESADDYNKCNKTKGGLKVINDVKVISHTIAEIQKKQKDRDVFAVGRYQLIPITLNSAVTSLGLDINKKLDSEMQDKIFDEYLIKVKRPKIIAYLEGNGTIEDAMYSSSQEWASIGVEKGRRISDKITKDKNGKVISRTVRYAQGGESYYAGDGLNNAHITPEQIKNVLKNAKNANK